MLKEKLFDALMSNTGLDLAIYFKDKEGRFIIESGGTWTIKDKTTGKLNEETNPTIYADEWRKNELEVMKTQKTMEFRERCEVNGVVRITKSTKFPIYDDDGSVCGICGVSRFV
ncbi:MAG TPA: hypothetical protein QF753_03855 [Victivallales bacterium]|nr:hypothetical protein [Victivallales bacterium]